MSYHVHQIDSNKHQAFLAQLRKDPVAKREFRTGDEVVFCAICKAAFLKTIWISPVVKEEHCGQTDTLDSIPSPRINQRFSSKKGASRASETPTSPPPIESPAAPRAATRVDAPIEMPAAPTGAPFVPPPNLETSPIRTFSANTFSINFGHSITLNWDVAANYVVSINNGIGSVPNTGVRTITPGVWFWGWLWLRNKREVTYALTAEGPNGTFRNKLQVDLTLPALPAAISPTIQLAPHSVILSRSSPLHQLKAPLRQAAVLLNYNRLRTFFGLKQNQIKLGDYMGLIKPPEIIRNLSTMPFYQRIPVGFFRRFKHWANTA